MNEQEGRASRNAEKDTLDRLATIEAARDMAATDLGSWCPETPGEERIWRYACGLLAGLRLCACGCTQDMHIGEIGCPCALPGEPPCVTPPEPDTSRGGMVSR